MPRHVCPVCGQDEECTVQAETGLHSCTVCKKDWYVDKDQKVFIL